MKQVFKPYNLLFYFLATFVFFFLGMTFAGITGAGKGQGLAGGAIVFGYGVIAAGIALIASIFFTQLLGSKRVILLNKILLGMLILMLAMFAYRIQTLNSATNHSHFQSPRVHFSPEKTIFFVFTLSIISKTLL